MLTHHRYQEFMDSLLGMDAELFSATEVGFIIENTMLGPKGANTFLEDWQWLLMCNIARYQWWGKSRQTGFSFGSSLKKLARSYLHPLVNKRGYLGIFLSINLDEAQNKIYYVQEAWDTLPNALKNGPMKLVGDSKKHLIFANGSRIFSHPAKAVRGAAGADITLDEFAHVPKANIIYRGTTAASVRAEAGQGGVIQGSTPLGETGAFYEFGHSEQYKEYRNERYYVYWWDSLALCNDVVAARLVAETENWPLARDREQAEQRVMAFGSPNLRAEFNALPLEDFLQEYEIAFNSVSDAIIPYADIDKAINPEWPQVMREYEKPSMARAEHDIWPAIQEAIKLADANGVWAGLDPARKKDQWGLVLSSPMGGKATVIGRFILKDAPFYIQEWIINKLLADPRTAKLCIDNNGLGYQLAENALLGWGEMRVELYSFTNAEKEALASRMKALYSSERIMHTGDREIIRQVGSLRKKISPNGNKVTIEGGGSDNHADIAWALALSLWRNPIESARVEVLAAKSSVAAAEEEDDQKPRDEYRDEYKKWLRERRR